MRNTLKMSLIIMLLVIFLPFSSYALESVAEIPTSNALDETQLLKQVINEVEAFGAQLEGLVACSSSHKFYDSVAGICLEERNPTIGEHVKEAPPSCNKNEGLGWNPDNQRWYCIEIK